MKITKDMVGKELYLLEWDEKIGKHHKIVLNPSLKHYKNEFYVLPFIRENYAFDEE